jgi:FKBP-type peptidyl-prolyl cis-trans isomerase 2
MQEGDFVKINYVGRIAASNEVFDLTEEAVAKKEGLYNEKKEYGPTLVILGAHMVIPGVEKQLESMSAGQEREFSVKPAEAFGFRDPRLVIIVSRAKFLKENINPMPGMVVDMDGRHARIQSVSGGRVRVDLNNPLAGKELKYELRVVEQLKEPFAKVDAIIKLYKFKCDIELAGDRLTVRRDKPLGSLAKNMIEEPVKKWIKEIKTVEFVSKEQNKKEPPAKKTISEK